MKQLSVRYFRGGKQMTKTEEIAKAMNDLKTEQYENKTLTNNIDIESV